MISWRKRKTGKRGLTYREAIHASGYIVGHVEVLNGVAYAHGIEGRIGCMTSIASAMSSVELVFERSQSGLARFVRDGGGMGGQDGSDDRNTDRDVRCMGTAHERADQRDQPRPGTT